MSQKSEEKIWHASSRKIIIRGKNLVKFYPTFYGYLLHDIGLVIFYVIYGISSVSILSPRRKILNEFRGREVLRKMGVRTTEIIKFSLKEKYLEEKFVADASTIDDMENSNPTKAIRYAKTIGEITRKLNDKGHYFIDNRSSNWMADRGLIRTDLELFQSGRRNRNFFMFCDMLSFISSIQDKNVRDGFIDGYGKKIDDIHFSPLLQFFVNFYIRMTDLIF
jgi:tRNA A-37 threonylcarbamoyl transferase component Bud32